MRERRGKLHHVALGIMTTGSSSSYVGEQGCVVVIAGQYIIVVTMSPAQFSP